MWSCESTVTDSGGYLFTVETVLEDTRYLKQSFVKYTWRKTESFWEETGLWGPIQILVSIGCIGLERWGVISVYLCKQDLSDRETQIKIQIYVTTVFTLGFVRSGVCLTTGGPDTRHGWFGERAGWRYSTAKRDQSEENLKPTRT